MGIADWFSGRRAKFREKAKEKLAEGDLSKEQDRELARLQKYLALRDDQIDKTRTDLKRLRTVEQIGQGQLPVVSPDNVALRGLRLEAGEVPYCCVPADLYEAAETPSGIGVRFNHDAPYEPGSSRGLALPVNVASKIDEGFVIVTSKRFIFKGGQTFGHKLAQNQNYFLYEDGIRLPFARGHLLFQLRAQGQTEVIGSLLTRLKAA